MVLFSRSYILLNDDPSREHAFSLGCHASDLVSTALSKSSSKVVSPCCNLFRNLAGIGNDSWQVLGGLGGVAVSTCGKESKMLWIIYPRNLSCRTGSTLGICVDSSSTKLPRLWTCSDLFCQGECHWFNSSPFELVDSLAELNHKLSKACHNKLRSKQVHILLLSPQFVILSMSGALIVWVSWTGNWSSEMSGGKTGLCSWGATAKGFPWYSGHSCGCSHSEASYWRDCHLNMVILTTLKCKNNMSL